MAYRYTDTSIRAVYSKATGTFLQAGKITKFWADAAGTVPIDVGLWSSAAPNTPGASTGSNQLVVQDDSMWPAMWDRVGTLDHMWIQTGTVEDPGDLYLVYCDADQRADELNTRVTALEPGGSTDATLLHKAGAETITGVKTFSASPLVPAADGLLANAAPKGFAQIAPSMTLYETQAEPLRKVLYQFGTTIYAATQDSTGTVSKSTDLGTTWTNRGNIGFNPHVLMRIEASGTLIAVAPNPTATVKRSTDDGTTWTTVTTLNFAPLNGQGITETPSGYLLIGEYGNIGNTVYRVMRSTDDGQTFTAVLSSSGTAPISDPGHVHSVTYDRIASKFVAYLDYSVPQIFSSSDQGATWTLIGLSDTVNKPNFTAPMYFPNYIAWGYDNENNGKISRLPRADFHSGNWANVEQVAQVNKKAFYGSFPVADGTWIISQASETIGAIVGGAGAYSQEVFIVDQDGGRVSGGIEHSSPSVKVGTMLGQKAMLPAFNFNTWDHSGNSWLNLNTAAQPREFTAVSYSVGSRPPMPKTPAGPVQSLVLQPGIALQGRDSTGTPRDMLFYDSVNNRTSLRNPANSTSPEVRIYEGSTGLTAFLFNGSLALSVYSNNRVQLAANYYLEFNNNGPRVMSGTGTPEAVVSAPVGSMFLRSDGGAGTCLYVKESGTGNTGWVAK